MAAAASPTAEEFPSARSRASAAIFSAYRSGASARSRSVPKRNNSEAVPPVAGEVAAVMAVAASSAATRITDCHHVAVH